MSNMIKLARERKYPYIVNYISDSGYKKGWEWAGSKNGQVDIKEIPEEVVLAILENLRSGSGQTKIVLLENSSTALQTANLQETSTYFDMFALPEDKANKN